MRARVFAAIGLGVLLLAMPVVQAVEAGGEGLPPPERTPSAERGKEVFERIATPTCASCHGAGGDGSGFRGPPPAANFHDLGRFAARSDADLWDAITNGRPADAPVMPAFGERLTPQQKWDLIAYLRTFMYETGGEAGPPKAEGVHLRAYWLGLIGLGATFLLMAVSFGVIRFTKKR